ncbi:hypothetical protein DBR23_09915 [Acidovorax sp. HMWF018]|nr:hypothetical protein DBR23_09915 [Acidovorax sp. HMWF018]
MTALAATCGDDLDFDGITDIQKSVPRSHVNRLPAGVLVAAQGLPWHTRLRCKVECVEQARALGDVTHFDVEIGLLLRAVAAVLDHRRDSHAQVHFAIHRIHIGKQHLGGLLDSAGTVVVAPCVDPCAV